MKRTQIQLPDHLYSAANALAERKEISMAELVRRGLEYMIAVNPMLNSDTKKGWALPEPKELKSIDPFSDTEWRSNLHMERFKAAETSPSYDLNQNEDL